MALWTPADISAALWLDASDSSTITISTGVSQWADKSGNANHAVQATGANQPALVSAGLNGLDIISFDGSNDLLSIADHASLQFGTGNVSVFAVVFFNNVSKGASSQNTVISKDYTGFELYNYQGSLSCYIGGASNGAAKSGISSTTWYIAEQARISSSLTARVDAVSGTPATNSASASAIGTNVQIGQRPAGTSATILGGKVGEILVVASADESTISIIEGYLAWKWGLEANLPAGHPYKSAAPISTATFGDTSAYFAQAVADIGDAIAWLQQDVFVPESTYAWVAQNVESTGDTSALFVQSVGDTGIAGALFAQNVADAGDTAAWLAQSVEAPTGDTIAWLAQSVAGSGDTAAWLAQNVYSISAVAASWANWDCSVRVDGVEYDNLIDSVRIEAERNAARTAEFTVALSGAIDVLSWVGRSVQIDYVQYGGARWRRFTGVIVEPVFDMTNRTLRCTCSDDLQRVIDGYRNTDLQALTGGAWSEHVFNKDNTGWDYLQDLLTTVPVSVEMDSNRVLRVSSLNNKATPDYEFDALILDQSLSVDLVRRSSLINRVNLTFDAGFTRLWQSNQRVSWKYSRTFCEHYWRPATLPTTDMVQDAIEAAGWSFVNATYTMLWPSGSYRCDAREVGWFNNSPDTIRGFSANAAFRWSQNMTASYQLSVIAPASISAYGELASEASASASFDSSEDNWSAAGATISGIPSGFAVGGSGTYFRDEVDTTALNAALSAAVAQAANTIAASHRSNRVSFALPLAPYLELHHTVQATDDVLTAKGIVNKITETYSFLEGDGSAVTEVELLLSSGQSGLDVVEAVYTATQRPAAQVTVLAPTFYVFDSIPTYVGGYSDSEAFDDTWEGYITNLETPDWDAPAAYPNELRIAFDAIPDAKTTNQTETLTADIAIAVPHNLLTITA